MPQLIFATSNKGKIAWLKRALAMAGMHDWQVDARNLDLTEIQSDDVAEISLFKARQAFEKLQQPVVVMDGGFSINGLNGFPGAYARSFIERIGIEKIGKIIATLDDKSCKFYNVATYCAGPDDYAQFHDDTGKIFTLTPDIWPHPHPEQWSDMWRALIPSGLGYTKPLAALSPDEMSTYAEQRTRADEDNSSLNKFVQYLRDQTTENRKSA